MEPCLDSVFENSEDPKQNGEAAALKQNLIADTTLTSCPIEKERNDESENSAFLEEKEGDAGDGSKMKRGE